MGLAAANPDCIVQNDHKISLQGTIKPREPNAPLAVIIEPSRELAEQVHMCY